MTLRLRRKRPITPPNTPRRRAKTPNAARRWPLACAAGLLSVAGALDAFAATPETTLQWIAPASAPAAVQPVAWDGPLQSVVKKPIASAAPRELDTLSSARPLQAEPNTKPTTLQWRPVQRAGLNTPAHGAARGAIRPTAMQADNAPPRDPFEGDFELPPPVEQRLAPTPLQELPESDAARPTPAENAAPTPAEAAPIEREQPVFGKNGLEESEPLEVGPPGDQKPQQVPGYSGEGLYYAPRQGDVGMSHDECDVAWKKLQAKTLPKISLDIDVTGVEGQDFPLECELARAQFEGRYWCDTTYLWKASSLCHKPLYFEEVALERYGHTWGPFAQPFVSGAHFFATVPILPYKMGLTPPSECIYALGYYRPGNCAPKMISPLGFTPRAGLLQAGAVVGAAAIIP